MKKAFTMLELIFVIVVIGILSSVALPKFADAGSSAYMGKAKNTLAIVKSAIATERQRRILSGQADSNITALNVKKDGTSSSNVFDHFNADGAGTSKAVMEHPESACINGGVACWSVSGTTYTYTFPDTSIGSGDGKAKFILQNNRLDCASSDTADCALLES